MLVNEVASYLSSPDTLVPSPHLALRRLELRERFNTPLPLMHVYYSPDYTAAGYAFDTTRKATLVADTLTSHPIPGVDLIAPPPLTAEQFATVHAPDTCRAVDAFDAMSDHEIQTLWEHVTKEYIDRPHSVHGPDHWRRVERNGLLLAQHTGANVVIVRLFALFHDCRRVNDCRDRDHGARGAEHARLLRGRLFDLPDEDFERLHHACTWHTDAAHHKDPTIGTCWDADRLDLGRVGIVPDSQYMSTVFARKITDQGGIDVFLSTLATTNLYTTSPISPKP